MIVALAPHLLSLFGGDFKAHAYLTTVLAFGFVPKSFVGPAELYLNVLGHQKICALTLMAAAAVNMVLGGGRWELDPGQALLIEFDEPQATYWSIQTYMLAWLQPLDFTHRVTSLYDVQAQVDHDGIVRVVVAHDDPGVQNWLDTSGLPDGLVSYRWVRSVTEPTPMATVVDLGEVSKHLPTTTPRFSAENRRTQLASRSRGVDRRFRR